MTFLTRVKRGRNTQRDSGRTHIEGESRMPICGARLANDSWQSDFAGPCTCKKCKRKAGQ